MLWRRILLKVKLLSPVVIGLCIGIALSLIFAPFLEDSCDSTEVSQHLGQSRKTNSYENIAPMDYSDPDDFEPVLRVAQQKTKDNNQINQKPQKFYRPRYAASELGIREKLFTGVLSSPETLSTLGVSVNKTLSHYVQKLVFFVGTETLNIPNGMTVVNFAKSESEIDPLSVFRYMTEHFLNGYDYYLLLKDDTYVQGERITEFVTNVSVSQHVYIGMPAVEHNEYCSIDAGLLLSQSVLNAVSSEADWCAKNIKSRSTSDMIGQCVYHAMGLQCNSLGLKYSFYRQPLLNFDESMYEIKHTEAFQEALTVGSIKNNIDMYKIHKYFCELELNRTRKELENTKDSIVRMSQHERGNIPLPSWPIGVQESFKPKSRFDVIRWDYFTEKEVYLNTEFNNVKTLDGVHKEDIDDVIKVSIQKLNEKYKNIFDSYRLLNGYRRFDSTRGMEYTLDLVMRDKNNFEETKHRVHLVRPLSKVELVPMPYVTENSRVNLILPITVKDRESMSTFLEWYARTCLDSGDNTNLFIVLLYSQLSRELKDQDSEDVYSSLKSMINYYENKYENGARIAWISLHSSEDDQLEIFDAVSKKFPPESLLALCSVNMELTIEYLNRVRMNTIAKWQVFFPIPFQQYKPNLVYEEIPDPLTVEVAKNYGYFDIEAFDHASFYNADYMAARQEILLADDLFELFVQYQKPHIFRAVEPGLKLQYQDKSCNPLLSEGLYNRCLARKSEGLASRSQLALLVFENQLKLGNENLNILVTGKQ